MQLIPGWVGVVKKIDAWNQRVLPEFDQLVSANTRCPNTKSLIVVKSAEEVNSSVIFFLLLCSRLSFFPWF